MKWVPGGSKIMRYDIRRLWRLPFIGFWIVCCLLIALRTDLLTISGSLSPNPATGQTYSLTQDHVYYITAAQHHSLQWFGAGIAIYFVCYLIGCRMTGQGPYTLPIDREDDDPYMRRSAIIFSSIGAVSAAVCMAVSYSM